MDVEYLIDTLKARGATFSETDVTAKFDLLVNYYGVSEDDAVASIINYYTKSGFVPAGSKVVKINQINAPDKWVTIEGTVVSIYPNSSPSIRQAGLIKDDTGTIRYVIWEKSGFAPLEKFKTYRLEGVVTSEYNKMFSVGVNRNSAIIPLSDKSYVDMDSIRVTNVSDSPVTKIKDLLDDAWVTVRGKVVRIFDNTSPSIAQHGIIADETGSVRYVIWKKSEHPPLEEGASYEIQNARTSKYNDRISLYINSNSLASKLDEDIPANTTSTEEFTGAIIRVLQGSGVISRCPECNRALQKGICATHGKVNGVKDYRIKLILDDGLEYRNVILNRELSERVSGIKFTDAMEIIASTLDNEAVRSAIESNILGRYMSVYGRKIEDTIIASDVRSVRSDELYQSVKEMLEVVSG